jgi:hypothetical protein
MLEGDREYSNFPTLPKLCDLAVKLIHKREKLHHEYVSLDEFGIDLTIDELGKHSRHQKSSQYNKHIKREDYDEDVCLGCNRLRHTREKNSSTPI